MKPSALCAKGYIGMLPRQITSFVFAPLCGAVLLCASSAGAASIPAQTQTKDQAAEVRCADEGQWKRVPGGSRPAYAGIQGGTVPVSLLQASNGTIFVIPGRTGNDFTHVLRGTNGTPDNATQAAKPTAKPVAQAANATQPEAAPTVQAAPQPEAAKTIAQTVNATQAATPVAQAAEQPESAKPVAQAANATQPAVAPTAQAAVEAEAIPAVPTPTRGEPTPTAQATDKPETAKPVAQADTEPKAENPAPQPTATPQAASQPEAAPAAQAAPKPEETSTTQAAGKSETAVPVAQADAAPKADDQAVSPPEAVKPVAQAETAPKTEGSAAKIEAASAAQAAPTRAPAAVQAQAEPAPPPQNEHVVFASADLAARLHEEPELAPFGLTDDATEVERPVQQARPVKPKHAAVFKPLRLGSYKAVLANR